MEATEIPARPQQFETIIATPMPRTHGQMPEKPILEEITSNPMPPITQSPTGPIVAITDETTIAEPSLTVALPTISQRPSMSMIVTMVIGVTYGIGMLLIAGWFVLGALSLRKLVRGTTVSPSEMTVFFEQISGRSNRTKVRLSPKITTPIAAGTLWPTIMLPTFLWEEKQKDNGKGLQFALAHEWAHINNGDLWFLAIYRLLALLLFPNPLFWWLGNRMRENQELLADAYAAELTFDSHSRQDTELENRREYALELVRWSRIANASTGTTRASVSTLAIWEMRASRRKNVQSEKSLACRVDTLLNEERLELKTPRRLLFMTMFLVGAIMFAVSLFTWQPQQIIIAQTIVPSTNDSTNTTETGIPEILPDTVPEQLVREVEMSFVDENGTVIENPVITHYDNAYGMPSFDVQDEKFQTGHGTFLFPLPIYYKAKAVSNVFIVRTQDDTLGIVYRLPMHFPDDKIAVTLYPTPEIRLKLTSELTGKPLADRTFQDFRRVFYREWGNGGLSPVWNYPPLEIITDQDGIMTLQGEMYVGGHYEIQINWTENSSGGDVVCRIRPKPGETTMDLGEYLFHLKDEENVPKMPEIVELTVVDVLGNPVPNAIWRILEWKSTLMPQIGRAHV